MGTVEVISEGVGRGEGEEREIPGNLGEQRHGGDCGRSDAGLVSRAGCRLGGRVGGV